MLLVITTHPDNKRAVIGSTVTLTCASSLSSNAIFTWSHNGTIVTNQQTFNNYTSRLTISNVKYNDSGSYMCTCVAWKVSLVVRSNTATITVYGKLINTGSYVYTIALYSSQTSD